MSSARLEPAFTLADRDRAQFSPAERALFTACDFWAAVCSRRLATHLGAEPIDALRYVLILYAAIGADSVVREVIAIINESEPDSQHHRLLVKLQERLIKTHDPVDQLIARLALSLGFRSHSDAMHLVEPAVSVRA